MKFKTFANAIALFGKSGHLVILSRCVPHLPRNFSLSLELCFDGETTLGLDNIGHTS
ncbi:hypothetical protein ACLFKQ_28360 [Myxosarcina sp. GI1(2024)]